MPQSLTYLVDDVSRRHGLLRAGGASSYLRCDDEALLGEVVATRAVAALGVRRLAPTVLVCQAPVTRLLEVLRGPASPRPRRTPRAPWSWRGRRAGGAAARGAAPGAGSPPVPRPAEHLAELVARLRESDRAAAGLPRAERVVGDRGARGPARRRPGSARPCAVAYVDAQGRAVARTVPPSRVEGGFVSAVDPRTETSLSLALHRVTSVAVLTEDARLSCGARGR